MAAITVADELAEAGLRIKRLEEELAALQDARVIASDRTKAAQAAVAIALSTAAERIEGITKEAQSERRRRQRRSDGVMARRLHRHYIAGAGLPGA